MLQIGTLVRRFSRPGKALAAAAALALPSLAWAGSQGLGIGIVEPPDDTETSLSLMNWAGESVARFVCIDDPGEECFELVVGPGPPGTSVVTSPECPAGPASRRCRPDTLGPELDATLDLDLVNKVDWDRTDVSSSYPLAQNNGCVTPGFATTIVAPAGYTKTFDPAIGTSIYADTGFPTVRAVPTELECAEWIQTDSADAGGTAPDSVVLDLGRITYVYVAFDADAPSVPSWLSQDFSDTGLDIEATLVSGLPADFDVWRSNEFFDFNENQLALGGNEGLGRMYFVLVRPPDATEFCSSYAATVSVDGAAGPVVVSSISEAGCYVEDLNNIFLTPPPLVPGVGYYTTDDLSCESGAGLVVPLELERSLGVNALVPRYFLVEVGQDEFPTTLCQPGGGGKCTFRPTVSLVEPDGSLTIAQQIGRDPQLCSFTVRYANTGVTRAVVWGPAVDDVDDMLSTTLTAPTSARGLVADADVFVDLGLPYADHLSLTIAKDGNLELLANRVGCNTLLSSTVATFDDESANPPSASCGTLFGVLRPEDDLSSFDGMPVVGDWELGLVDFQQLGNGTDLREWKVHILTTHTQCSDGVDNDFDGTIDWDGGGGGASPDPQCFTPGTGAERKKRCGLGFELAPLALLGAGVSAIRRRRRA